MTSEPSKAEVVVAEGASPPEEIDHRDKRVADDTAAYPVEEESELSPFKPMSAEAIWLEELKVSHRVA